MVIVAKETGRVAVKRLGWSVEVEMRDKELMLEDYAKMIREAIRVFKKERRHENKRFASMLAFITKKGGVKFNVKVK